MRTGKDRTELRFEGFAGVVNFQKAFRKIKVGQCFVVPWFETDKMGIGRPKDGATCGFGAKVFKMDKVENGIKVTRLK